MRGLSGRFGVPSAYSLFIRLELPTTIIISWAFFFWTPFFNTIAEFFLLALSKVFLLALAIFVPALAMFFVPALPMSFVCAFGATFVFALS